MSGVLKTSNSKLLLGLALCLIGFGVVARWLPHPPNFAPIGAIALFGGAILPKRLSIITPLMAMVISDMLIGFHSTIFWTWGAFVIIAIFSSEWLRSRVSVASTAFAALIASTSFFLITNFGVWLQGGLYQPSLSGLMQSYINGLPFFRNTLLSDITYSFAIFGLYFVAVKLFQKRTNTQTV